MSNNEGGPAFPGVIDTGMKTEQYDPDSRSYEIVPRFEHASGMTLRDYFAAKAMQGLIAHQGLHWLMSQAAMTESQMCLDERHMDDPANEAVPHLAEAEVAYEVADAMLAARDKTE